MPGEREAREPAPAEMFSPGDWLDGGGGKGIHSVKKTLDLHEMDSLSLAAYAASAFAKATADAIY